MNKDIQKGREQLLNKIYKAHKPITSLNRIIFIEECLRLGFSYSEIGTKFKPKVSRQRIHNILKLAE